MAFTVASERLIADARDSSKRKVQNLRWYKPLYRIPKTYFRANILGAAADCTVSIVVDTYRYCGARHLVCLLLGYHHGLPIQLPAKCCHRVVYLPAHKGHVQRDRRMVLRRLLRICAADVLRCTTGLAVASVGALS